LGSLKKDVRMKETKKNQMTSSGKKNFVVLIGAIVFLALLAVVSIVVFKPIELKKWGDLPLAEMIVEENVTANENEKEMHDGD
jgi:hypothetical protein